MFDAISKSKERVSFEEIFAFIPKFVTALGTVLIVSSILYEYMYFWTIGRDLNLILSPSDYLKLTVCWVPVLLVLYVLVIWFYYSEFQQKLDAFESHGYEGLKPWRIADNVARYALYGALALSITGLPFIRWDNLSAIQLPVYFIFGGLITKQISTGRLPLTKRPIDTLMFYLFIVVFTFSAGFNGLRSGISDVNRSGPLYNLSTDEGQIEAILLRSIDKGMIIRSKDRKSVVFMPWNRIKKIESSEIDISNKSVYEWARDAFNQSFLNRPW